MNVGMAILLILLSLFALILLIFEKSKTDEKTIAVVASLGALAAIARVPFAGLPNVQPTTFLVMLSGYIFGMRVGFLVGGIAALFSNVFLGQGPWTLWQMLAWGLSGASAGLLRRLLERWETGKMLATPAKRWIFSLVCMLWGFLFGWIMNMWMFLSLGALMNMKSFLVLYVSSLSFDTAHAVGNFLFAFFFAAAFARILVRYHRKLVVSRLPGKEDV